MQFVKRTLCILSFGTLIALVGCSGFLRDYLSLGGLTLPSGSAGYVVLYAQNFTNGLQGVEVSARAGDYLHFDPSVLRIRSIKPIAPFFFDSLNIENQQGRASFIVRAPALGPFPSTTPVIEILVEAIGPGGSNTELSIWLTNVADGNAKPVLHPRRVSAQIEIL